MSGSTERSDLQKTRKGMWFAAATTEATSRLSKGRPRVGRHREYARPRDECVLCCIAHPELQIGRRTDNQSSIHLISSFHRRSAQLTCHLCIPSRGSQSNDLLTEVQVIWTTNCVFLNQLLFSSALCSEQLPLDSLMSLILSFLLQTRTSADVVLLRVP